MKTVRSVLDELWDKGKQGSPISPGDQYIQKRRDGSYYLSTAEQHYPISRNRRWLGKWRPAWLKANMVKARLEHRLEYDHYQRSRNGWVNMRTNLPHSWEQLRDVQVLHP